MGIHAVVRALVSSIGPKEKNNTMETIVAAIVALALAAYLLYALLRPERF